MEEVQYRDVPGFTGYRVGDDGSIWSRRLTGHWRRLRPQANNSHGHLKVELRQQGKTVARLVHRLVLEAFVGPCPAGMECRHFPDRSPANNRLNNLSWATPSANQADRDAHGTSNAGEANGQAKLTAAAVRSIRRRYIRGGVTYKLLADEHGVHPMAICRIMRLETWRKLA